MSPKQVFSFSLKAGIFFILGGNLSCSLHQSDAREFLEKQGLTELERQQSNGFSSNNKQLPSPAFLQCQTWTLSSSTSEKSPTTGYARERYDFSNGWIQTSKWSSSQTWLFEYFQDSIITPKTFSCLSQPIRESSATYQDLKDSFENHIMETGL